MQIGPHSHLAWELQQELTERLKFALNCFPSPAKRRKGGQRGGRNGPENKGILQEQELKYIFSRVGRHCIDCRSDLSEALHSVLEPGETVSLWFYSTRLG